MNVTGELKNFKTVDIIDKQKCKELDVGAEDSNRATFVQINGTYFCWHTSSGAHQVTWFMAKRIGCKTFFGGNLVDLSTTDAHKAYADFMKSVRNVFT